MFEYLLYTFKICVQNQRKFHIIDYHALSKVWKPTITGQSNLKQNNHNEWVGRINCNSVLNEF